MAAHMMTAYRRGEKLFHIDSLDCLAAVETADDMELVEIAIAHHKPVLIGLNGHNTIVKIVGEDDEDLSFESLYDTAFTSSDLGNMHRQGAATPDEIKPDTFRVAAEFEINIRVPVNIALRARTNAGSHPRLRELLRQDPMFREAVRHKMISLLEDHFAFNGEILYAIDEVTLAEPATLADDQDWLIL